MSAAAGLRPFCAALVLASATPLSGEVAVAPASALISLVEFSTGHGFIADFDSVVFGEEILILVHEPKPSYRLLKISGKCEILRDELLPLEASRSPGPAGDPALLTDGRRLWVLSGRRSLRVAESQDAGATWIETTLTIPVERGTFGERSTTLGEDGALHVVAMHARDADREDRTLLYLGLQPGERHPFRVFALSEDRDLNRLPASLDARWAKHGLLAIVSRTRGGGEGTADLFEVDSNLGSWTLRRLRIFRFSGRRLVHLVEDGTVLVQGDSGGIVRLPSRHVKKSEELFPGPIPTMISSVRQDALWIDDRFHGRAWWGAIPGHQIFSPDASPNWINNNLFIGLDHPRALTPTPGRVETARIHLKLNGDSLLVIWLGYRRFEGRSEQREEVPLTLYCQRFQIN